MATDVRVTALRIVRHADNDSDYAWDILNAAKNMNLAGGTMSADESRKVQIVVGIAQRSPFTFGELLDAIEMLPDVPF